MLLLKMQLRNFKNTKSLDINFNGQSMNFYGKNDVGKSTIADAYFWLLIGKDLLGRKNFEIFPYGAPDGVEPTVYAEFQKDDGTQFSLKRSIKKNFIKKRGETFLEYKGNNTEFYINDIPKKAGEYINFIDTLGGEELISIMSNPDKFSGEQTKWTDRRKMLLETFAPDMSEKDIIERHEELHPLLDHIGAMYPIKDILISAKTKRKDINKKLDNIPGRIDELIRMKPEVNETSGLNIAKIVKERQDAVLERDKILSGGAIADISAKISEIKAQAAEAKSKYIESTMGGNKRIEEQCSQIREKIQLCQNTISEIDSYKKSSAAVLETMEKELAELRTNVINVHHSKFDEEVGICPTCGQSYPKEHVDKMREKFNLQKAEQEKSLTLKGKELAEMKSDIEKKLSDNEDLLAMKRTTLSVYEGDLKMLQQDIVNPKPYKETAECKAFLNKIAEYEDRQKELETAAVERAKEIDEKIAGYDKLLDEIRTATANAETIKKNEKRLAELENEEKKLGIELAKVDNLINLCEKFSQVQADDFEEVINSHFKLVKWKLFDRQINGGISPACEATVDGIEYNNSLNVGKKVKAGLDIINAFIDKLGYSWPVFVDGVESVTDCIPVNAQTIKLRVSEQDEELRMEAAS